METVLIQHPSETARKAVVFLPGMSGGAASPRFDRFADACLEAGFAIARLDIWKGGEDLKLKTFGEVHVELNKAIEHVVSEGFAELCLVGKSFGGGVALSHFSPYVKAKVAWAPAIGVSGEGDSMLKQLSKPLGEFQSFLDIKMSEKVLESIDIPVLIIHGTSDQSIPFSNSEKIATELENCSMVPIDGADHSFSGKEDVLIRETIAFLNHTPSAR